MSTARGRRAARAGAAWVAAATLGVAGLAHPSSGVAQEAGPVTGDSTRASRLPCLHGAPPPACVGLWIVEVQASRALWRTDLPEGPLRSRPGAAQYEWNLGYLRNLDERWALGGTVSLGSGSDDIFTGVRARLRRWTRAELSVEAEAGLALSDGNGVWYPALVGLSVGGRANLLDWGSVFVRYDRFGTPQNDFFVGPDRPPVEFGPQSMVRAGVGLGGKGALVATGAVAVVYGIVLGAFIFSGGLS